MYNGTYMTKKIIERIVKARAESPDKTVDATKKVAQRVEPIKTTEKFWHISGPGLSTGAADDDPSGIAT